MNTGIWALLVIAAGISLIFYIATLDRRNETYIRKKINEIKDEELKFRELIMELDSLITEDDIKQCLGSYSLDELKQTNKRLQKLIKNEPVH